MDSSSFASNYELLCKINLDGHIPVLKYRSKSTGLHVIIAQVEGPLVNGYFTLATESQDDDGLPHTLEHLIFLGSEDYPFKGVLDLLANRCLASGTNAWTDIDHTAYTVQTAGSTGFLNLLPIYLDHLLYPSLTEAGFITEVYHITGDGEDAGVVYSEMQARENTGSSLTYLEMLREMYPEPSGYRYETGGIMKNLRESVSNEKIRKYHADYYRPENLHIIITGQVKPEEVFDALSTIENKIIKKNQGNDNFTRPWESVVPKITESVDREILYASDSEDTGMVRVAWRGPSSVRQIQEVMIVEVLMKYLTYSSISPLPRTFVEVDDPLASEVYEGVIEHSVSCIYLTFEGVPASKIDKIKPLLMETFNNLITGVMEFNLNVMNDILNNLILKEKSNMETSPHDTIAYQIIGDVLYGYTCKDLEDRFNKKDLYTSLLEKDSKFWLDKIQTYLLDGVHATLRGVPSIAEAARIKKEQEDRVAARKQEVGETGLQKWTTRVVTAKEQNELPPPSEMLRSVPVPGIDNINFHSLSAYDNLVEFETSAHNSIDPTLFNIEHVPVKFQLDDLRSNFVQLVAILDTSSLDDSRRPYLTLLLDLLLESPIVEDGRETHHEEVIKQLAADTLKKTTFLGLNLKSENNFICGSYCNNAVINFKIDMKNYEKGVKWLKRVLFNVKLDPERIRVKVNKLLNSIGEYKRDAMSNLRLMYNDVTFSKNSNKNKINFLRQQKFLECTLERVEREPEAVIKEIKEVYESLTRADSITVHMSTDLKALAKLGNPSVVWKDFLPEKQMTTSFKLNTMSESEFRTVEEQSDITGYLTALGSVESGYILQVTPCINQYMHWDLPALLTAIQYLTQLEGPMWKEIRGRGLAYSYGLDLKPSEGTLSLRLTRSAQPDKAYSEAINMLTGFINGSRPWEEDLLVSARSSLIYEVIEREAEVFDALQQSLLAYYRNVPHSYNKDLLSRIADVSLEDVKKVALKYFTPLIDPKTSQTVVVCHPSKKDDIMKTFNDKHGHKLQLVEDISKSRFSSW